MSQCSSSTNDSDAQRLFDAWQAWDKNPRTGVAALEDLVHEGNASAMIYLGLAYVHGQGVSVDLAQAEELFQRATSLGSDSGCYHLGRTYLRLHRYEEAERALKKAADANYCPALHHLGKMYDLGMGVAKDSIAAKSYLERATKCGNIFAQRRLGGILIKERSSVRSTLRGIRLILNGMFTILYVVASEGEKSERLR